MGEFADPLIGGRKQMTSKIVVVGYCASGKSTVVDALQASGLDAVAVGQEHSGIADLWRHPSPDVVVFLDVELEEIRKRRGNPHWPEWIYQLQQKRLANARQRANIVIDTSELDLAAVVREILGQLGDQEGEEAAVRSDESLWK